MSNWLVIPIGRIPAGSETPLVVENGTFSWGPGEPAILSDINLRVGRGQLVAVVGSVGAGKTSLLSAVLGEMEKQSGRINSAVSEQLDPHPRSTWASTIIGARARRTIWHCAVYSVWHCRVPLI